MRLTNSTGQRTLVSPPFSSTKEHCVLEVFIHQSGMQMGSLRIIIEPLNMYDSQHRQHPAASSWVPAEYGGNDYRHWEQFQFAIGRVTQDFRILFEVVPRGLRPQQRGHVSLDDLALKNCFPEGTRTGTCSNIDVRCQTNKVDVCIKRSQVCDINVDCDEKEDELLNCGK